MPIIILNPPMDLLGWKGNSRERTPPLVFIKGAKVVFRLGTQFQSKNAGSRV